MLRGGRKVKKDWIKTLELPARKCEPTAVLYPGGARLKAELNHSCNPRVIGSYKDLTCASLLIVAN